MVPVIVFLKICPRLLVVVWNYIHLTKWEGTDVHLFLIETKEGKGISTRSLGNCSRSVVSQREVLVPRS
jgi:hypothetical protein